MSEIRRAAPGFMRRFAARISEEDRAELRGTTGASDGGLAGRLAADAAETLAGGGRVWAVWLGAEPAAVFGVRPDSPLAASAALWMVSSREAERRPVAFARWSCRCLAMAAEAFPEIASYWNWIPARDARCAAWLRFLGARFPEGRGWVSPWTGETFVMFEIDISAPGAGKGEPCRES